MTALLKPELISEEEYLRGELYSDIRHEYIAGRVYAMAGASDDHNRIALNIASELQQRLRGKRCEAFMNDMKLKIARDEVFYYPDVLVVCDPKDNAKYFRERPTIVVEVLSPETERLDTREKQAAYALIPSLKMYVRVSQDRLEAAMLRKTSKGTWSTTVIRGLDGLLKLPEIAVEIPFQRIYERTALVARRSGA